MHGPINVKSLNNTSKWQMGFNSAFRELIVVKVKEQVKFTLEQVTKAQRESRGIEVPNTTR
jgi:hypothetical protein